MAYTVLARKYRSQEFDQVVGQEPIARTLQSAIEAGRVAHAYLFCGTRGVGKTSMARLFAKALAGADETAKQADEINAAIMRGEDTDVIEIDGASNRGVEEARDVIANSVYRPLRGKRKVYIIDEVHMLTMHAFNALLKTMEEPPEHVVFILCTTEPHKVPATIQSRCQRFDFQAISTHAIAEHLARVVKEEGVEAEPSALEETARLGNGSMRDALSILDRLMATGEKTLTLTLLDELLGMPDRESLGKIIDSLAEGQPHIALEQTDALLRRGTSIDQFLERLIGRLHDLLLFAACGEGTALVSLSGDLRDAEANRAAQFDAAGLVHMIALCENVQRSIKNSSTPRALLDAVIVRLALTEKLADITSLVKQLDSGERLLEPKKA